MSEDSSESNDSPITTTTSTHTTRKTKKEEIFGFPKDDVTLGLAAAGLGLAGIVGAKIVSDMMAEGKLPNPFAPNNPRISYSDVYDQQRQQQEWESQQQAAQHQQPQQQRQVVEGGDPAAQTMPAFTGATDEFDIEGEQFSTAPPKRTDRFNRINST